MKSIVFSRNEITIVLSETALAIIGNNRKEFYIKIDNFICSPICAVFYSILHNTSMN